MNRRKFQLQLQNSLAALAMHAGVKAEKKQKKQKKQKQEQPVSELSAMNLSAE